MGLGAKGAVQTGNWVKSLTIRTAPAALVLFGSALVGLGDLAGDLCGGPFRGALGG